MALVIIAAAILGLALINVNPIGAGQVSSGNTGHGDVEASNHFGNQENTSLVWPVVKMLSALVIVIVAVYLAMFALKKLSNRKAAGTAAPGSLDLMQTVYVGPHKTVSLVRVGGRSVLVGVTDQNISLLTELTPQETEELTVDTSEQPGTYGALNFSGILDTARDKVRQIAARKSSTATQRC